MLRLRIPMERQSHQRQRAPAAACVASPAAMVLFTVIAHNLPPHFCATREFQALSSRSVLCWGVGEVAAQVGESPSL